MSTSTVCTAVRTAVLALGEVKTTQGTHDVTAEIWQASRNLDDLLRPYDELISASNENEVGEQLEANNPSQVPGLTRVILERRDYGDHALAKAYGLHVAVVSAPFIDGEPTAAGITEALMRVPFVLAFARESQRVDQTPGFTESDIAAQRLLWGFVAFKNSPVGGKARRTKERNAAEARAQRAAEEAQCKARDTVAWVCSAVTREFNGLRKSATRAVLADISLALFGKALFTESGARVALPWDAEDKLHVALRIAKRLGYERRILRVPDLLQCARAYLERPTGLKPPDARAREWRWLATEMRKRRVKRYPEPSYAYKQWRTALDRLESARDACAKLGITVEESY